MYKHMGVSKNNGFSPKWDFSKVKKQNEQLAVQGSMTTPLHPTEKSYWVRPPESWGPIRPKLKISTVCHRDAKKNLGK